MHKRNRLIALVIIALGFILNIAACVVLFLPYITHNESDLNTGLGMCLYFCAALFIISGLLFYIKNKE